MIVSPTCPWTGSSPTQQLIVRWLPTQQQRDKALLPQSRLVPAGYGYGATDPAEFFAVATETFFEKPLLLKRKHPEFERELKRYYKLEPLEWMQER